MEEKDKNNQNSKGERNFGLPGDYFEKSAQSIYNKIEWEEEHKAYPALFKLREKHGFYLPESYFERLEVKLELLEYPILKDRAGKSGFLTPADYEEIKEFEAFEKFKNVEENELSSFTTLKTVSKQNNFYVPQEYFVSNGAHIKTFLADNSKTKVISLVRRSVVYAAAALLLVVLSVGIYDYYFKPAEVKDCGTIACVDRIDLVKTKNLESLDNDQLYELVNPAELEKNLDSEKNKKAPATKADSGLKDIPTEELLDEI